jgi:hypothetical protein
MLYGMTPFLFLSSFFCLCTGILVVLFCLFVSIFVDGSCFKSRSPIYSLFYPWYESSKGRFVRGAHRPKTNCRKHIDGRHIAWIIEALPAPLLAPFRSFFFNPFKDSSTLSYFSSYSVSGFNVIRLQRRRGVHRSRTVSILYLCAGILKQLVVFGPGAE